MAQFMKLAAVSGALAAASFAAPAAAAELPAQTPVISDTIPQYDIYDADEMTAEHHRRYRYRGYRHRRHRVDAGDPHLIAHRRLKTRHPVRRTVKGDNKAAHGPRQIRPRGPRLPGGETGKHILSSLFGIRLGGKHSQANCVDLRFSMTTLLHHQTRLVR